MTKKLRTISLCWTRLTS